jgi:hypothetical protein
LPEHKVRVAPWEEVAIDINLIRPLKVKVGSKLVEFNALMCIHTASNLVELVRIDNKTLTISEISSRRHGSVAIHALFVVYTIKVTNSLEKNHIGCLERFSVKDVCSTSKNPQSNAICERMHQTVENVLRILVHAKPPTPKNMSKAKDIVDDALATAMHTMRTTVATTL